jgi:hypothetical protein
MPEANANELRAANDQFERSSMRNYEETPGWFTMPRSAYALALAITLLVFGPDAKAQSASLEGSWSGGGLVSFASGARERAQCRATYSRRSATSYTVRAVCATASARAAQTASLRYVGENRYRGSFYNSEYAVSGIIDVVVRGSVQNVRLTSSAGWATFRLSR